MTPSVRGVSRAVAELALPIVGVNVGMMLMGAVDTLMVGRLSPEALAAVALGNVYFFAFTIVAIGILLALDPLITHALGAKDHGDVERAVQRGLVLAGLLSIPVIGSLLLAGPVLGALGQPAEVVPLAGLYDRVLVWGILPFLAFNVFRQTLQAHHIVAPVLWTILAANLLNIGLNWVLIFGQLGLPAMGVAGSAWATNISRWFMALMLLGMSRRTLWPTLHPWHGDVFSLRPLGRVLRLGLPIGLQLELEYGAFAAVAVLMGRFGTIQVAGHQIALNLASLTFMVPMGIGMAAAVVVGRAVGANDAPTARTAARAALLMGTGFMACCSIVLLLAPRVFAGLYTTDAAVLAWAATLIPIAGIFQVFDGIQAVSVGILRGFGDTRAPMLINLVGFGVVGIGASLLLAFRTPLGAIGLWWGLVIGLAAVAVVLVARIRVMVRRPMARVRA